MKLPGLQRSLQRAAALALGASLAACAGSGNAFSGAASAFVPRATQGARPHAPGLGPVLSSKFGGGIFGWDMNQNGNDGFFTEYVTAQHGSFFATETFDEPTATVTKVVRKSSSPGGNDEPFPEAVVGNDIGFIDLERVFVRGNRLFRNDQFHLMTPVSGNKINGISRPPQTYGVVTSYVTNNQSSPTEAMMVTRYKLHGRPQVNLYLYDSATNTWLNPYAFGPREIFAGYVLYAAVDAPANEVFVGYQAGLGNPEQIPPRFDVFDGGSGKLLRSFKGLGHGFLNGMAIDSTTGIMCTTTYGDMEVEFYTASKGKGFAVTIPGSGGALTMGAAVAVDQVNHLFLVAQQNSTVGAGSTVYVYDEKGNLIEAISGFSFLNRFSPLAVHIAANGTTRTGYVPGPNANNLQSFSY
jgi:hypothetical protein